MAAGFERLHGDPIANGKVLDSGADCNDFAAELMAENDRILMPVRGCGVVRVVMGPA